MLERIKGLPLAAGLLLAGGLALVGWLGWNEFKPPSPPYRYVLVAEGAAGDFPVLNLSPEQYPDLLIKKYELRLEASDEPLVALHVAESEGSGPVLLDWHSDLNEPFINISGDFQETTTLAEAIRKHYGD